MFYDRISLASNDTYGIAKVDVNTLEVKNGEVSLPADNFPYTGEPQIYTAPEDGIYLLEVQGAQGGPNETQNVEIDDANYQLQGGYGAYAAGYVELKSGDKLTVIVGGAGDDSGVAPYNGGGVAKNGNSGGGATHICYGINPSELKEYIAASETNNLLIVAGGGGGVVAPDDYTGDFDLCTGGNAGGVVGNNGKLLYTTNAYDEYQFNSNSLQDVVPIVTEQDSYAPYASENVIPPNYSSNTAHTDNDCCVIIQSTDGENPQPGRTPAIPINSEIISEPLVTEEVTESDQINDCILDLCDNETHEPTGKQLIQQHVKREGEAGTGQIRLTTRLILKDGNNYTEKERETVDFGGTRYAETCNLSIGFCTFTYQNVDYVGLTYFSFNTYGGGYPDDNGRYILGICADQFEDNDYDGFIRIPSFEPLTAVLGVGGNQVNPGLIYQKDSKGAGDFGKGGEANWQIM